MSEYEKKLRRIDSVEDSRPRLSRTVEGRSSTKRIGSFQRRSIRSIVERTIPRVHTEALVVLPNDPNELTHAILAALFKPEVAQQKIEAARQTISKFHPRQRLRALQQMLTTAKR